MLLQSPNIDEPFFVTPLTCRHQQDLAQASLFGPPTFHHVLLKTLRSMCQLSDDAFSRLTILDYFVLLLQCRSVFIDNSLSYNFTCPCTKTANLMLEISHKLGDVDSVFNIDHKQTVKFGDLELVFNIPKINDLHAYLSASPSEWIVFFLQSLNGMDMTSMNITQRQTIFNGIPYDIHKLFENVMLSFLDKKVPKYIFTKCPGCLKESFDDLNFVGMFDILRNVLFNFDVDNCVVEYAVLSKKLNINPSYVSGISPSEKQKFLNLVESQNKAQETSKPSATEILIQNSEFGF